VKKFICKSFFLYEKMANKNKQRDIYQLPPSHKIQEATKENVFLFIPNLIGTYDIEIHSLLYICLLRILQFAKFFCIL